MQHGGAVKEELEYRSESRTCGKREDMPGKSLNEGTDTWNGTQPLHGIQKQILSRGPTGKTGKGNMPDAHAGVCKREVFHASEGRWQ